MTTTQHLHIYSFKFQRLNYNGRISFKSQDIWRDRSFSGVQFHISLIRKQKTLCYLARLATKYLWCTITQIAVWKNEEGGWIYLKDRAHYYFISEQVGSSMKCVTKGCGQYEHCSRKSERAPYMLPIMLSSGTWSHCISISYRGHANGFNRH